MENSPLQKNHANQNDSEASNSQDKVIKSKYMLAPSKQSGSKSKEPAQINIG